MVKEAPAILNKGGYILFEIGFGQSEDVVKLLKDNGYYDIEVVKDLANIYRVICAKVNK